MAFLGSFADSSPSFLFVRSFTCCRLMVGTGSGVSFFSTLGKGSQTLSRKSGFSLI